MDKTSYENLAKAWRFIEEHELSRQSDAVKESRSHAQSSGVPQGSAAQADALRMLVRLTGGSSAIIVGTGSLVEAMQLAAGLETVGGTGQLTAVDSSSQGFALIRAAFNRLADNTTTKLRAVNAAADDFLPKLNAGMYDLIVVAGDADNYGSTFEQAPRLLKSGGVVVFTDMLALEGPHAHGGVLNPVDRSAKATLMRQFLDTVESDERFDTALVPTGTGMLIAAKR